MKNKVFIWQHIKINPNPTGIMGIFMETSRKTKIEHIQLKQIEHIQLKQIEHIQLKQIKHIQLKQIEHIQLKQIEHMIETVEYVMIFLILSFSVSKLMG